MYNTNFKRLSKKMFSIIILMFFTVSILIVSTYAWMVGTSSVSTSGIVVGVSSEAGIELSLDGEHWASSTLTLDEDIILGNDDASSTNKGYANNKNIWPSDGLFPISTKGEVDTTNGRLKLYNQKSITATLGGFRFVSNLLDNSTTEKEGYVAFDLFIRNGTGVDYISTYNEDDDEAIYLTRTSSVTVTATGGNTEDYGLANSVRVAFMQVGRVNANTTQISSITGINCTDSSTNTELCSHVTPTIWEPNNAKHNTNLIAYYNSVCKTRTALNTYTSTACTSFTNNQDVDTYVVKQAVTSATLTDIYDGHNGYTNSNLENIDTFTDADKNSSGQERSTFMKLAPNSITKLRVYIYLEGQDVDNYSLISNGNLITINFGFTKNVFSEESSVNISSMNTNTLYYKVASQAKSDSVNFSIRSETSETNGVYKTSKTDSGDEVYYYRGNVNNYVIFNNMCWRIVRTTETGGVKLIYNGTPTDGTCVATGSDTQIGASKYNSAYNDNAYVGYMYGTAGNSTYAATHTNTNSSTIKTYIDNWYSTNFTSSSVTSKIEDTVYCNDRSIVAYDATKINWISASSYTTLGYGTNATLYGAINRASYFTITPSPTLVCLQSNDKFTVSNSNGNGALTYPVGLITLDEVAFAGFNTWASNSYDYVDTNNYLYTGNKYWVFSPYYFGSGGSAVVGCVTSDGFLNSNIVSFAHGTRPVISLSGGVTVTGSGTSSSPYVVQ